MQKRTSRSCFAYKNFSTFVADFREKKKEKHLLKHRNNFLFHLFFSNFGWPWSHV